MTPPWEGSGHHAQISCSCHQVTSPSSLAHQGRLLGCVCPCCSHNLVHGCSRPLSLLSPQLPPGAGPPLPTVMLQWVRSSVCTTWECSFKCNIQKYLFYFVLINAFGIYFWNFFFFFFSASLFLKNNAKSSYLLLKQSHSHTYFH